MKNKIHSIKYQGMWKLHWDKHNYVNYTELYIILLLTHKYIHVYANAYNTIKEKKEKKTISMVRMKIYTVLKAQTFFLRENKSQPLQNRNNLDSFDFF